MTTAPGVCVHCDTSAELRRWVERPALFRDTLAGSGARTTV
jgi:hypothetical protein